MNSFHSLHTHISVSLNLNFQSLLNGLAFAGLSAPFALWINIAHWLAYLPVWWSQLTRSLGHFTCLGWIWFDGLSPTLMSFRSHLTGCLFGSATSSLESLWKQKSHPYHHWRGVRGCPLLRHRLSLVCGNSSSNWLAVSSKMRTQYASFNSCSSTGRQKLLISR